MNFENNISQQLFGKPSLAQTQPGDWQRLTDKYPYFSAAQFFLSKRLLDQKDLTAFQEQTPKTALHFSDVLWLDFLLKTNFENVETLAAEVENPVQLEEVSIKEEETEVIDNEEVVGEAEMPPSRLSSVLGLQLEQFKKPVSADEKLPSEAEPLFRTDYFASQGIIFTKPKDELGKKVKKFTDWLKDIKQANDGAPQLNTTEEEEKRAAKQALASLEIKETITEPMAEVLLQQNKKQQAIQMYKKLSLLYPEKSTYFAAKVNSLAH